MSATSVSIEDTVLTNLVHNENFTRKVISFLDESYFKEVVHKTVYRVIAEFIDRYNARPTPEAIKVELSTVDGVNDKTYFEALEYVAAMEYDPEINFDWLIDQTEKFCQYRAVYNGLVESIGIANGDDDQKDRGAIVKILQDAISVSFDDSVGHDFADDAEVRYELLHRVEDKIKFDIEFLNRMTKGGIAKKTLTVLLAGCVHPDTKIVIRRRRKAS